MANKIFETSVKEIKEEDIKISEKIYIFEFEDDIESEDFELYSHNEQLAELGFKENTTPNTKSGKVVRYSIECLDSFIIVIETITEW